MERWKRIPGFNGYEASSLGRVRCVRSSSRLGHDKIVSQRLSGRHRNHLYYMVTLRINGKRKDVGVHTLVCSAFHGPRPAGTQVAHKDGDGRNNRSTNVRWATPVENCADRFAHGRTAHSDEHYAARLTNAQVRAIRAEHTRLKAGRKIVPHGTIPALAARYGVSRQTITNITTGSKWRHV